MLLIRTTAAAAIGCVLCSATAYAELSGMPDQIVVDGVALRFGDTIEVQGVCVADLDWDSGPATIRVLRIGGKPTQEQLDVRLSAGRDDGAFRYEALMRLPAGTHYFVRGRLTNARINGLHNVARLMPEEIRPIAAAELRAAEFVDREAVFEGQALAGGRLNYGDETIRVAGIEDWPEQIRGKSVAVRGTVRKAADGLLIERPTWKLFRLEDLVNQRVVLDGVLLSLNGEWWFNYRDQRLDLTWKVGPRLRFDGDNHYRQVRVRGELILQDRPSLDQISVKWARDLVPTYAIRGAAVEFSDDAPSWEEKFDPVYASHHTSRNGVPELLAESSLRRNFLGDETQARLFLERNRDPIARILRKINSDHRDEIARRMTDDDTDEVLRLIYAAILANANDRRGREYLSKRARATDPALDVNALYCLGAFPFLAAGSEVDAKWAEETLVEIMRNMKSVEIRGARREAEGGMPVAVAAVHYSSIPIVLRKIGSASCRRALLEFVKAKGIGSDRVAGELCRWKPALTAAELLDLDELVDDRGVHREIMRLLLAQKSPIGVEQYAGELENAFIYMDFRDYLSPEIVDTLKRCVDRFEGRAQVHARILIGLGQEDAIAELLRFLADEHWEDKNIVFYELARLGDPRAVAAVARFLSEAPKDAVKAGDDLSASNTVRHAVEAIAHAGTAAAIHELIELLPVDLARFGGSITREEWRLVVAGHLIELTGESFGTDVDGWRNWQRAHPEHHVPSRLANPAAAFRLNSASAIDLGR